MHMENLNKYIEHTLLKQDATRDELAEMFIENFKKYITATSDFSVAGPNL